MAVDFLEEFLKRIREGQAAIPVPQARSEQFTSAPAVHAATAQPVQEARPSLLGRLFDTSEEARAERRATLLPMGAAMMVAGGPSRDPTNFLSVLGQGVAAGTTANDAFQKDAGARAAERARSQMQEQLLTGLGANGSNTPYSIADLKQILAYQVRTGDDAGARDTLGMIQALQKEAADNGMIIDESGSMVAAPGYNEGLGTTEQVKAAGRVAGEESERQTDDIREYNLYVKQTTDAGEEPLDFTTWVRENKKAGSTQVNLDTGLNGSKYGEKNDTLAAERHNQIVADGSKATQMIGDMQMLADLGRQVKTGKGAEIMTALGPWAEMVGVEIEGLDAAQAFKSITDRLAPQMRPVGSGSSSDLDVKMFLNALPNIGNTSEGNEIINYTWQAISKNKIDAAEIVRRSQLGEITWQEADKQIEALPNPYSRFKEFQKAGSKPAPQFTEQPAEGPVRVLGGAQFGGTEEQPKSIPQVNSPEDAYKLPSDVEFFTTPDGRRKRNPNFGKQ